MLTGDCVYEHNRLSIRWCDKLPNFVYGPFILQLVFEATTNSYYRNDYSGSHTVRRVYHGLGYIAIDDVYVYNTSCGCK